MKKFTFKKDMPTGRSKLLCPVIHLIKLGGKEVGKFGETAPISIRFMVEKDDVKNSRNPNCPWKWVKLNKEFSSPEEARQWLRGNSEEIQKALKLHKLER